MIVHDLAVMVFGPFGLFVTALAVVRAIRFLRKDHQDSARAGREALELFGLAVAGLSMIAFTALAVLKIGS